MLKEQLKDSNRPAFRSAWQDVELVWRVLRALVARLDLGGMGPLVARALDPGRMTLAKKDVSEYVGVAIRVGNSVLFHSVRYVLFRSIKRTFRSFPFFS